MTDQLTAPERALIQWLSDEVGLSKEREAELARRLAGMRAADRKPDGYMHRYNSPFGGTDLRLNDGVEVNGCKPIEAVPYWLGSPPIALRAPQAVAPSEGEARIAAWVRLTKASGPIAGDPEETTGDDWSEFRNAWTSAIEAGGHIPLPAAAPSSGNDKLRRLQAKIQRCRDAAHVCERAQWHRCLDEIASLLAEAHEVPPLSDEDEDAAEIEADYKRDLQ